MVKANLMSLVVLTCHAEFASAPSPDAPGHISQLVIQDWPEKPTQQVVLGLLTSLHKMQHM